MERLIADITPELKSILRQLSESEPTEPIGALVERLLRSSPEVDQFRVANGIEWRDRPAMGRPRKIEAT